MKKIKVTLSVPHAGLLKIVYTFFRITGKSLSRSIASFFGKMMALIRKEKIPWTYLTYGITSTFQVYELSFINDHNHFPNC